MRTMVRPLLASLAAVLAGIGVLAWATDGFSAFTTERARRLAAVRDRPAIPAVAIETSTGAVTVLPDAGRVMVVEFIYTRCPVICQWAGDTMARLRDRLAAGPLADRVRLVSLSFDPQHDDPSRLADYARWHRADGVLWTIARPADPSDLPALLTAFGVTVIPDRTGGYVHNVALHVIDPGGRLVTILDADDVDGAAAILARMLQ